MNSLPSCVGSLLHWLSQLPCLTAQLASCVMPFSCLSEAPTQTLRSKQAELVRIKATKLEPSPNEG